jgi:hypothetical protein
MTLMSLILLMANDLQRNAQFITNSEVCMTGSEIQRKAHRHVTKKEYGRDCKNA